MLNWIRSLFTKVRPRPHRSSKPHPANVPGQFYVEEGCCMTCGVPEDIAPELFGWVPGENHCHVKKQPASEAEMEQMLEAMSSQEAGCIRARFCDPAFFERLKAAGEGDQVDGVQREDLVN